MNLRSVLFTLGVVGLTACTAPASTPPAPTAARHKRKEDVYSEDGIPGKRPNHAAIVYSQMARRAFPGVPVVKRETTSLTVRSKCALGS